MLDRKYPICFIERSVSDAEISEKEKNMVKHCIWRRPANFRMTLYPGRHLCIYPDKMPKTEVGQNEGTTARESVDCAACPLLHPQ